MATTDSNGILFYEVTDSVSPLQVLLNSGQQSISDALNTTARIFPVASIAARNALSTTYGPTASKPLYVNRADAVSGRQTEYTVNGTEWIIIPAGYTSITAFTSYTGADAPGTFGSSFANMGGTTYTQPVGYQKVNGRVYLSGVAAVTANIVSGATIAWLPVGFRPHATADTNGRRRHLVQMGGTNVGTVEIYGNGKIIAQSGTGAGDNYSLDGISFEALG